MNRTIRFVLLMMALTLSACGGGGGGGATPGDTTCKWDSSTWDNCKFGS